MSKDWVAEENSGKSDTCGVMRLCRLRSRLMRRKNNFNRQIWQLLTVPQKRDRQLLLLGMENMDIIRLF